ncbi:integrase-like protein [Ruminiclostridium sufflavum DSM 19573]|uniref:Integrase-like protein n=1 Tax=Ruminiclostridium sufflavum DSM 19573 TaxID=1121337 RepID=A0A318XHW9_9FIRM|nr:IS3 family transposase [Ruminiclostridium sufflavum]PYG86614.1 integrase-like protein [Ruminiclostridium sufflavum DSM 19573]
MAFKIRDHNDNPLVIDTFDEAIRQEPDAHPLFHSDRGFQYTSKQFYQRLKNAGMKHSMSRVAHCIDNGPMEGFWGILKREMYYGHRFTDRGILIKEISDYIDYYNNKRLQRKLLVMTPMSYHNNYRIAA